MGDPIQDPLNIRLPEDLTSTVRTIYVAPGKTSTFRLMHDPYDAQRDRWFQQGGMMGRITDGNEVKALVRGQETYADMADCMVESKAKAKQGFIYLLGWNFDGNAYRMPLRAGDGTSTPENLFGAASKAGVEIRLMVWANGPKTPFETPYPVFPIDSINKLVTGRGVVDWKTGVWWDPPVTNYKFHVGAHHQKVVLTYGGRLTAFAGGVDLDVTRLDPPSPNSSGPAWQDVHCRVRGPAADDVLELFKQRWDDYFNGNDNDANHDTHPPAFTDAADKLIRNRLTSAAISHSGAVDGQPHRQSVQVCRTFHSKLYDRIPPGGLTGEKTIRNLIKNAIGQAERFIYMEDQYLVSMEVSDALKGAIAKQSFRWLIILIPGDGGVNPEIGGQASYRRALFIQNLKNAPGGEKVKVFAHNSRYVHSKIYLIDDIFSIIGSANCNRRGMEHDSEISLGIFDKASDVAETLHFTRRLRMRLFATHLNFSGQSNDPNIPTNSGEEFAEVADGIGSAAHWVKPPKGWRVSSYTENLDLNLAIQGLQQNKAELKAKVLKYAPGPAAAIAISAALDANLARFSLDKAGVDRAWDELFDPGD